MSTTLDRRIEALDETRRALLTELGESTTENLTARPNPEKWSVIEIVEHLVIAEREILGGLPDVSTLVGKTRTFKNRILYSVVMMILRYDIPVKVPSRGMIPKGEASLTDLGSQWDENRRWLDSYVAGLDDDGLRRAVFVHPVAGPMTVTQAIRMDQLHVDRHIRQIRGILSSKA